MIKKSFYTILFFFLFACNGVENKIKLLSESNEKRANGEILRITETYYGVNDFGVEPQKSNMYVKKVYEYDEDGNLKAIFRYSADNSNTPIEKIAFIYNDSNELIKETKYYYSTDSVNEGDMSFGSSTTYSYDSYGNRLEVVEGNDFDEVYFKGTYKYDENNNLIENTHFRGKEIESKVEYKWGKGEVECNLYSYYKGKINSHRNNINKYNENGKLIESLEYGIDSLKNKKFLSKSVSKYDDYDNFISGSVFDHNGKLIQYSSNKYENFDKYNNWLKKIEFNEGRAFSIIEREIIYKGGEQKGIIEEKLSKTKETNSNFRKTGIVNSVTSESKHTEGVNAANRVSDKEIFNAKELKLLLIGSNFKKAEVALGEPDAERTSGIFKVDCVVYYNRVRDVDGAVKNVVLIRRWGKLYDFETITISDVLFLSDNSRFKCAYNTFEIKNGKLLTDN